MFKSNIGSPDSWAYFGKSATLQSTFRSKALSITQMQERVVAFRGRCCNMNGIIKYSFSQRKREKDLAPHWDDAALSVWFLQTIQQSLSVCLSDPLSTICLILWYFQPNSGEADVFEKWKSLQVKCGLGEGRLKHLPFVGERMLCECGGWARQSQCGAQQMLLLAWLWDCGERWG